VQIDWFTLVAQIINFLILLYLLKRFLYGPIVETMEKREQKIAARLEEAQEKRESAEREAERYHHQRQELEKNRDERMAEVHKEIEAKRKEMLEEAQEEIQAKKQDWQEALQREKDNFLRELHQQLGRKAGEIARRALQDLADIQVEQKMVDLFILRLQEIDSAERNEIAKSIQTSDQGVIIRSAFELPEETQQKITEVVQAQIMAGQDWDTRFETSPELISGIEMQADSHQVAWSIKDYLVGLETQIRQTIEQEDQQQNEDEHGT
jgi:F-type H+-transporting ATPase subunit b